MNPGKSNMNVVLSANKESRPSEEPRCLCIIYNEITQKTKTTNLPISTTQQEFFQELATKFRYVAGSFEVYLLKKTCDTMTEDMRMLASNTSLIATSGLKTDGSKNYLAIRGCPIEEEDNVIEEELTTYLSQPPPVPIPPPPKSRTILVNPRNASKPFEKEKSSSFSDSIQEAAARLGGGSTTQQVKHSVGLVNQAMTCYLNSLIQTLYMTPEFRNGLYRWEYKGTPKEAITNIPYQLQRLFLALQTSTKGAVETTDLTRSFGWDSSEAWQQHDIQELCRVMFDALELSFKDTEQADMIKDLYEGKMKDYVSCCECGYESARVDSFLDIPITIRPFGSNKLNTSVTEGLQAFVEPETLEGSNQYFCEKCDKKCDAKKGLKFTKFPYLLTLQLKRFDFDYNTQHRVKLNDRMYFPQTLVLDSFIQEEQKFEDSSSNASISQSPDESLLNPMQYIEDDRLSRDSGNDDDRMFTGRRQRAHETFKGFDESEGSSVDEGIDIESQKSFGAGAFGPSNIPSPNEVGEILEGDLPECDQQGVSKDNLIAGLQDLDEANKKVQKNSHEYELFSIMIHSGSAIGGHYYAYIKSFSTKQWYSFNDQIVSSITMDDIERSYGGAYQYSSGYSSYSSSTNAYMLMYRRIDPSRNKDIEEFPEHIEKIMEREKHEESERMKMKEKERNTCNVKVFCEHESVIDHPFQEYAEISYDFHRKSTMREVLEDLWQRFKLDKNGVALDNCRLVSFYHYDESFGQSWSDDEKTWNTPMSKLLGGSRVAFSSDLLLQTKCSNEIFPMYAKDGVTLKIFSADYEAGFLRHCSTIHVKSSATIEILKHIIAEITDISLKKIRIMYEKYTTEVRILNEDSKTMQEMGFYKKAKLFVDSYNSEETKSSLINTHGMLDTPSVKVTSLYKLIDRHNHLLRISIVLPEDNDLMGEIQSSTHGQSVPYFDHTGIPTTPPASPTSCNQGHEQLITVPHSEFTLAVDPIDCIVPRFSKGVDDNTDFQVHKRNRTLSSSPSANKSFNELLTQKLQDVSNNSSSSSLNCEDGYSSNEIGSPNEPSSNEFEQATANIMMSDSGSCSTLDSTDTLCNEGENKDMRYIPLSFDTAHNETITEKPLPGLALGSTLAAGDWISNRLELDKKKSSNQTLNYLNDCQCSIKSVNGSNRDPGYKCLKCGKLQPSLANDYFTTNEYTTTRNPHTQIDQSHEDEGLEENDSLYMQPLFSGLTSFNSDTTQERNEDKEKRDRTESTSSVMSDLGYDVSHDQFYIRVAKPQYEEITLKNDNKVNAKVLHAQIDKRSTVGCLKQHLRGIVKARSRDFSLYRVSYPGQEYELSDLSDNFNIMADDTQLHVKFERALRKNEHRCKVFLLSPNGEKCFAPLLDWVVHRGLTIKESRIKLSKELQLQKNMSVPPERVRLRRKSWESPGRIFLDKDEFGSEIILFNTVEIFLEILDHAENKLNSSQLNIYYRLWSPAEMTLSSLHDVIIKMDDDIDGYSVEDMKKELSCLTDIPPEYIEWAKPSGNFPNHMNVMDVHDLTAWCPDVTTVNQFPVNITDDGAVIFIRDKREELKPLTDNEKIELRRSENERLKMFDMYSSKSQRRGGVSKSYGKKEKALKIYTV